MQRNAETVRRAFQCSARLAARITELSADQFGRAFGISGENAEDAAQKSSQNVEAVVESGAVLTEITPSVRGMGSYRTGAGGSRVERLDAFRHCRTPHDFTALQSELLRDNMETVLGYARKAGIRCVSPEKRGSSSATSPGTARPREDRWPGHRSGAKAPRRFV
jgi:hypothetical protein